MKIRSKRTLSVPRALKRVRLVLVLHLIGWEGGVSFLNQSQSIVRQNQSNSGLLSTVNWKPQASSIFVSTYYHFTIFSYNVEIRSWDTYINERSCCTCRWRSVSTFRTGQQISIFKVGRCEEISFRILTAKQNMLEMFYLRVSLSRF